MTNGTKKLAETIKKMVREDRSQQPQGYTTAAEVLRVDGKTAWVHIPGPVTETPVQLTMDAKTGDTVQVRVSGGKAWITGNESAPPTDDATANKAIQVSDTAYNAAGEAWDQAESAKKAAASAQTSAQEAKVSAASAQTSADTANTAANSALTQLSTVENVVDTLTWITEHGVMTSQSGGTFVEGQVYFIADSQGDYVVGGTHYSVVQNPVASDIDSYYVLSIDEAVTNYVATHLAVDAEGLWIIPDQSSGNRVLIATGAGSVYTTAGTYIIGTGGTVLANFTASGAQVGRDSGGHSIIDTNGFKVYDGQTLRASISGNDLHYGSTVYGEKVRFRQDSMSNYLIYYFTQTPATDSSLYVEAFTGTDDAVPITEIVSTLWPLSSGNDNNYMRIHRSDAESWGLIDTEYDSTGATSVPLFVRYKYNYTKKGGALKIGTSTFDGNTVLGLSGNSTDPMFEITADGIFNYKNQYPVVYNPVTKEDVTRADPTLTTSSANKQWLIALLKAICVTYPNQTQTRFEGVLNPNSSGYYTVYIYDTAVVDENGLPRYSYGEYRKFGAVSENFGTSGYTFFLETMFSSSGGTLTGNLVIDRAGDYASIDFYTKSSNQSTHYGGYLRMYSQGESTPYGMNGVLQTGGNLFIGSGESPASQYALYQNNTGENTFITSDNNVYIQANGNTIADRRGFAVWQAGTNTIISPCKADTVLSGNSFDDTTGYYYLGADNYRWTGVYARNVYAAYIAVNGNAVYHDGNPQPYVRNWFQTVGSSSNRPTSANNNWHDNKMRYYLATSSMTTGKPPEDAQIIHLPWDNSGWDRQIAVGNSHMYWRREDGNANWGSWNTLIDSTGGTISGNLTVSTLNNFGIGGSSGNWYSKIPTIPSNGVMEIGRYIDFHISSTGTTDYDVRLTADREALTCSGSLTLSGHSSAIGTVLNAYMSSATALSANTGKALTSLSIPAGTWLVCCGVRFANNSSGVRRANLSTTSGATDINWQMSPTSGQVTQIQFDRVVTTSSTATYYLNGYSTVATEVAAGGTQSGTYITAVRIQ